MNSDNGESITNRHIHQTTTRFCKVLTHRAFLATVFILAIILAAVGRLYVITRNQPVSKLHHGNHHSARAPTSTVGQPTQPPDPYDVSSWDTFTSPTESFTLRIPSNWSIKDYTWTNCGYNATGYNAGIPIYRPGEPHPYDYCRESFAFISPDKVVAVHYIMYSDDITDDRVDCGEQSPCLPQIVDDVRPLIIGHSRNVFLVQTGMEVYLHKPVDNNTAPVIGNNVHITNNPAIAHRNLGYTIRLTLPSKTGARFALVLMPYSKPGLTKAAFYNTEAVKQGMLMLETLRY